MKKWYLSKTIWANLLAALLGILALFDADLLSALGVGDKMKFLSIVGTATTIINILLRVITNQAIDTTKRK